MHHLIFDLADLVGMKRTWLYKEPKVSVLQVNAQLKQTLYKGLFPWKGERHPE